MSKLTKKSKIDLSLFGFINDKQPLPTSNYPKTCTLLPSFIEAINAKDKRSELDSKNKSDRKSFNHLRIDKVSCCLTILSNINSPTKQLVDALFSDYLEEDESLTPLINKINTYRNYLKKLFSETSLSSSCTKDELCFSYIKKIAIFNSNGKIISLDEEVVAFYKEVISYWNNGGWETVYTEFKDKDTKPNSIRFIAQFCHSKQYKRATAQRYLVLFNNEKCFTTNDLNTITNGQSNLLEILNKIDFLTQK